MQRKHSRCAPLDFEAARAYLGFTERQLRNAVAKRRVAYYNSGGPHRGGGRLLFLVEDLDDLLELSRVDPSPPRRAVAVHVTPPRLDNVVSITRRRRR